MLNILLAAVVAGCRSAGHRGLDPVARPGSRRRRRRGASRMPGRPTLTSEWRSAVGSGQSSPVVSGDTVFVFSREGEKEVARALDLRTGAELWRRDYPAPYRVYPGAASFGAGPKSTPVVHDGRLFTLGISGILTAFDAKDGRIVWQKDFAGRFKATAPPFGTSMSPLVAGGRLIVHAGGHDGGALIAFDPATGKEKWTLAGDGPSYSSPIVTTFDGQEQIVIQVHRKILGVDPRSGTGLWSVPFVTPCDQNIVTPLRAGRPHRRVEPGHRHAGHPRRPQGRGLGAARRLAHAGSLDVHELAGARERTRRRPVPRRSAASTSRWTRRRARSSGRASPARAKTPPSCMAAGALLVLEGDGTLLVLPAGRQRRSPRSVATASRTAPPSRIRFPPRSAS